ncbi:hypothetical protein H6758_01515 [Candidatus Nomurabacteria bacterium]|nr:hypothetical protein [Candidatus Nomurabacteria bacterium]
MELQRFVLEMLPQLLECGNAAAIAVWAREHLQQLPASRDELTVLDLSMIETSLAHSGVPIPASLTSLLMNLTNGGPFLTYHQLVMVNPAQATRCFTRGPSGEAERAFYLAHKEIEHGLAMACAKIMKALGHTDPQQACNALHGIEHDTSVLIENTRHLAGMNPEHFAAFRGYLASHPVHGFPGPSGLFSPGVYLLELLLRGPQSTWPQFFANRGTCFDNESLRSITGAMEDGHTLTAHMISLDWPPRMHEVVRFLETLLDSFRGHHYKAVRKQIPQALTPGGTGTAGESAGQFLRDRMRESKASHRNQPTKRE